LQIENEISARIAGGHCLGGSHGPRRGAGSGRRLSSARNTQTASASSAWEISAANCAAERTEQYRQVGLCKIVSEESEEVGHACVAAHWQQSPGEGPP
jgi:hypothetical protein